MSDKPVEPVKIIKKPTVAEQRAAALRRRIDLSGRADSLEDRAKQYRKQFGCPPPMPHLLNMGAAFVPEPWSPSAPRKVLNLAGPDPELNRRKAEAEAERQGRAARHQPPSVRQKVEAALAQLGIETAEEKAALLKVLNGADPAELGEESEPLAPLSEDQARLQNELRKR